MKDKICFLLKQKPPQKYEVILFCNTAHAVKAQWLTRCLWGYIPKTVTYDVTFFEGAKVFRRENRVAFITVMSLFFPPLEWLELRRRRKQIKKC